MLDAKREYIAVFGENTFECLQLILWAWVRNIKMVFISQGMPSHIMNIPFIRKYIKESIREDKNGLGNYKGLWYTVNEEAIDSTLRFYDQHLRHKNNIINYYNKILNTDKFEAYIKKNILNQIFALLKCLHLVRMSGIKQNKILIVKNPINKFIVKYLEDKYKIEYQIRWISSGWGVSALGTYYGRLFKQFICRGIALNKDRKRYKISKEAVWGFYRSTSRDDILIDNERFKNDDMLILNFDTKHPLRLKALEEAKRRGFDTASVAKLKVNINKNIFNILFFYFWLPVKVYFQLLLSGQLYLFYYIAMFHKKCFPIEILMNLYNIKCHVSVIDYDDIATTIILNKYGAKNVIFHWSDVAAYKANSQAIIAHNIYFGWGDMHYYHHSDNLSVDKKIKIGCIFKKEYSKAVYNKEEIIKRIPNLINRKKIVAFFDSSFQNGCHLTVHIFLEFLKTIKEFCNKNKDISVLLKPKAEEKYMLKRLQDELEQYKKIWKEINSCENFNYLHPLNWNVEEVIAISDVCITMGMYSPSTIALICGKNALYFDQTGNIYHPFAKKYKNIITFEDKDPLFRQIDNILDGRFNCRDVIKEKEIREYDAFDDDKALERLRNNLCELTSSD